MTLRSQLEHDAWNRQVYRINATVRVSKSRRIKRKRDHLRRRAPCVSFAVSNMNLSGYATPQIKEKTSGFGTETREISCDGSH